MDEPIDTLLRTPDALTQLAVEFGPRLLTAALVLVAGYFVTRWIAKFAARGLQRFPVEPSIRELLLRVVKFLVFALFLLMALQNLGIDLLPLHRRARHRRCRHRPRVAGRARQRRGGPHDHLYAAVPRRRVHLDRGRGR